VSKKAKVVTTDPPIVYPQSIILEAEIRGMRPDVYVRELADVEQATIRMDEIDRLKLIAMQNEENA
jgi:hypothetical protein